MSETTDKKIALLIDGDNAQAEFTEAMLSEAGKYGKVTVRRIYGDWTNNRLNAWKEQLSKHSIRPMQKFAFASGKNATDTAMIIDAMDILHSGSVDGFCLASSDSDYTGLAQRIREDGIFIMGIGQADKTADAFVKACDRFVFTENLKEPAQLANRRQNPVVAPAPKTTKHEPRTAKPEVSPARKLPVSRITGREIDINQIATAINMVAGEDGFAYMGELGLALRKLDPGFDPRTYNYANMTTLFKKGMEHLFDFDSRDKGSFNYVRMKNT